MSDPAEPIRPEAEAARYALLRRLAPSLRHHLVVNLQPIGMIYEVMDRRLRAPTPDLAQVRDSAGKINGFAKSALAACIDTVSWLAPDPATATTIPESARECCGLLATSLGFRGYAVRNEVEPLPVPVRRASLRVLLPAALIHCSDHQPAPAELVLHAAAEGEGARVTLTVKPTQGDQGIPPEPTYRAITWADLEALAAAEGVRLAREGDSVVLAFPAMPAPPA